MMNKIFDQCSRPRRKFELLKTKHKTRTTKQQGLPRASGAKKDCRTDQGSKRNDAWVRTATGRGVRWLEVLDLTVWGHDGLALGRSSGFSRCDSACKLSIIAEPSTYLLRDLCLPFRRLKAQMDPHISKDLQKGRPCWA